MVGHQKCFIVLCTLLRMWLVLGQAPIPGAAGSVVTSKRRVLNLSGVHVKHIKCGGKTTNWLLQSQRQRTYTLLSIPWVNITQFTKTWPWLGHQNPCHGKQQTTHWHTCNELTTYQIIPTQITSQPKFQNSTQLSAMTLIGRTIVRICLDEAKAWSASQRIIIFTCLCLECLEANWCVLTIISA
jgi:hypothetical protein